MNYGVGPIVLCAAFCALLVAAFAPAAQAAGTPTAGQTVYVPLARASQPDVSPEQQVVDLLNQARRAAGCNVSLTLSSKLGAAAYGHSRDMALNNFFSHTGADGSEMEDRVAATGYSYSWLAENIAAGYPTPQAVVAGWMQSDGHKQNILNCELRETGVGLFYEADDQNNVRDDYGNLGGPYNYYWTQDFGTPMP